MNNISGKNREADENLIYHSPAPEGEFPIIASSLKYDNGDDKLPLVDLQLLKDGKFNVCMQNRITIGDITVSFQNAILSKEKLIFSNGYFTTDISQFITSLTQLAFGGFHIADEPSKEELEKNSDTWDFYWSILQQTKKFLMYINLNGFQNNEDSNKTLEDNLSDYKKNYLDVYQKNFNPSFFSFDYYPIGEYIGLIYEGLGVPPLGYYEGEIVNYPLYFTNLKLFSEYSKSHARPFWTVCLSMCMMKLDVRDFRPKVLEQYIRFQAFTALAYGSQGLVYWTYGMRPSSENNNEKYFSALLDRNDKPTASWYFAKKINEEIQEYRYIFLDSTVKLTVHEAIRFISEAGVSLTLIAGTGKSIIISLIKTRDNETYMVIVNEDYLNYQEIRINITNGSLVEKTPLRSGGDKNLRLTGNNSRILIPGGYRIFLFQGS